MVCTRADLNQLGIEEARRHAAKLHVGGEHSGGRLQRSRVALWFLKLHHPVLVF